jgi:ribonuclease HI
MGIFVYPYLDDCLIVGKSLDQLNQAVHLCLAVLDSAGFLINYKKSHLQPVQRIQFLGMELDSVQAAAYLPQAKAQHVVECLQHFLKVGVYKPVKLWLRLLGLMASTLLMVPYARLYMRPVQLYLNSQWKASTLDFNFQVLVPLRLIPVLRWWADLSRLTQGLAWSQPKPSITMTTDASLKAWGAHIQGIKVQGPWTKHQKSHHINVLELLAVQKGLKVFQHKLKNRSVLIQTDNTTVLNYINKLGGTRSPQLCQITWEMLNWCILHRIQLQAVHIPGVLNVLADRLSRRLVPHTESELNDQVVQRLFEIWQKP